MNSMVFPGEPIVSSGIEEKFFFSLCFTEQGVVKSCSLSFVRGNMQRNISSI